GDHGRAMPLGQGGDPVEAGPVMAIEMWYARHPDPPRSLAAQMIEVFFGQSPILLLGHEDEELALRIILRRALFHRICRIARTEEIGKQQLRIALLAPF